MELKRLFSRAARPRTQLGAAAPKPRLFSAIFRKSFAFSENGAEGWPSSPLKAVGSSRDVVMAGVLDVGRKMGLKDFNE